MLILVKHPISHLNSYFAAANRRPVAFDTFAINTPSCRCKSLFIFANFTFQNIAIDLTILKFKIRNIVVSFYICTHYICKQKLPSYPIFYFNKIFERIQCAFS